MLNAIDLEIVGKAALAAVLAFFIGWERERTGHPAGDRTFALVAMGSAVLTAVSLEMFPAAADRVIAGAVTGVGFLGAGMILRQSTGEIRGLTTAASIWAVNALGIVVGAGRYVLAVLLGVLIMIVLVWQRLPLLNRLGYNNVRQGDVKDGDG